MERLKSLEKITESDGGWEVFKIGLPKLHKIVESMNLNENVPEYVIVQFQQAQHLLIYSYLQFSLLSVAQTQALIALEFALITRWKNDPKIKQTKSLPGLKKLMEHAFKDGWIKNFSEGLVTIVPILRNASAHGEYNLNPIGTLEMVGVCGELIQHLYP